MEFRRLGTTDIELSVVGLGGYEIGNAGYGRWALEGVEPPRTDEIDGVLRAALDAGMNWIDTAEEYHATGNESAIGDALRRAGADDMLVCTKLWRAPDGSGFDRDGVGRGIRGSLERLGRDHVDMYLLHAPDDTGVPLAETWGAMDEIRREGHTRAIGLSNFERPAIEEASAIAPVDLIQQGLSMVDHLDERSLVRWCGEQGIGVQCYEPLGSSILTGAITRETDVGALWGGHLNEWSLFGRLFEGGRFERSMVVVDHLRQIAARRGTTVPSLAIAWVLAQPGVTTAIAGSRNPLHVADNAAAGDYRLDDTDLVELEAIVPLGPAFADASMDTSYFYFDAPTAEILLDVRTPGDLALSPDGSTIAFALHSTVADSGSFVPSDLYVIGTDPGATPVQLTSGACSDRTPAWSPGGSLLGFLSDRVTPGHQLPYTMPVAGGEPVLAATLVGSAESIAWSSDGGRLLVLAADPGSYGLDWSARAVNGAEPPTDPIIRRPGDARRRLFVIDLGSGVAEEVGPADLSVWEADWDGEDAVVAVVSRDHSGSGWYQAVVARIDLAERTAHTLYQPTWQIEGLALSPDARRVVVVEGYASDHGLLSGSLMLVDLATGATSNPWPDLQTVGSATWCDDGSLWYSRTDGTGNACGRIWLDGRREERWRDDAFIGDSMTTPACAITGDATDVWTTHQAHGQPPEIARFDHAAGTWSRVTTFGDHLTAGREFPDVRTIRWTADDGVEIEGLLMTPRRAEGPLPTIVCVHGGPTWSWGSYFSDSEPNAVLLGAAGYACLMPNPRGSMGRGHAFAQGVIGDGGGVDFRDIMSGVDHCIAQGIADPERLGIAGLSYGGYMAAWAIGQTDRFRASVAMSVVSDYVSFHLTSEVWWYDKAILKGAWHDPTSQYAERSPITNAHRATTPTLILQGGADRCTPPGQGEELFNALAEAGVEVELVVYPREGHVPLERAHALDAIERTQAWFDRYLRNDR